MSQYPYNQPGQLPWLWDPNDFERTPPEQAPPPIAVTEEQRREAYFGLVHSTQSLNIEDTGSHSTSVYSQETPEPTYQPRPSALMPPLDRPPVVSVLPTNPRTQYSLAELQSLQSLAGLTSAIPNTSRSNDWNFAPRAGHGSPWTFENSTTAVPETAVRNVTNFINDSTPMPLRLPERPRTMPEEPRTPTEQRPTVIAGPFGVTTETIALIHGDHIHDWSSPNQPHESLDANISPLMPCRHTVYENREWITLPDGTIFELLLDSP